MNPEILNSETFELTTDRQFQVEIFERQVQSFNRRQLETLLVQAKRTMMLKDNIIRNLLHHLPD
ncbi:MAG: NblA/ycf18 family protein [Cyanobacteria bacterium J06641_5]